MEKYLLYFADNDGLLYSIKDDGEKFIRGGLTEGEAAIKSLDILAESFRKSHVHAGYVDGLEERIIELEQQLAELSGDVRSLDGAIENNYRELDEKVEFLRELVEVDDKGD